MPGQLIYNAEPPIGVHGQLIENYLHAAVTGLAVATAIPVGVVVAYDTTAGKPPKAVRSVAASLDVTTLNGVAGITQWDPTYPEPPYRIGGTFPVLRKGRIAIIAETALAVHTNPFVRFGVVGAGTVLGALRADADAGNAVAAPYLTVVQGAAIGGVAIVEINL
jgi:hypothetical protein